MMMTDTLFWLYRHIFAAIILEQASFGSAEDCELFPDIPEHCLFQVQDSDVECKSNECCSDSGMVLLNRDDGDKYLRPGKTAEALCEVDHFLYKEKKNEYIENYNIEQPFTVSCPLQSDSDKNKFTDGWVCLAMCNINYNITNGMLFLHTARYHNLSAIANESVQLFQYRNRMSAPPMPVLDAKYFTKRNLYLNKSEDINYAILWANNPKPPYSYLLEGDTVRVDCDPDFGYNRRENPIQACGSNHTWAGAICKKECNYDYLKAPNNSKLVLTTYKNVKRAVADWVDFPNNNTNHKTPILDDIITVECDPLFEIYRGKADWKCQQSSASSETEWKGHQETVCREICIYPGLKNYPEDYQPPALLIPKSTNHMFWGYNVTFDCSTDEARKFILIGNQTVWNCLQNHTYDNDQYPKCVFECTLDFKRNNGTLFLESHWSPNVTDLGKPLQNYTGYQLPRSGDNVSLECAGGYALIGTGVGQCSESKTDDGKWERGFYNVGYCIGLCPANETRGNGTMLLTNHYGQSSSFSTAPLSNFASNPPGIGDSATLECLPNFTVSGQTNGTCGREFFNGTEVKAFHSIGQCNATCPYPRNISNNFKRIGGKVTPSKGPVFAGTNLTFECVDSPTRRFISIGNFTVWNCLENHEYDIESIPDCQFECPSTWSRANGTVTVIGHWLLPKKSLDMPLSTYNESLPRKGDTVRLTCDVGFVLVGNENGNCSEKEGAAGEWERGFHDLGTCETNTTQIIPVNNHTATNAISYYSSPLNPTIEFSPKTQQNTLSPFLSPNPMKISSLAHSIPINNSSNQKISLISPTLTSTTPQKKGYQSTITVAASTSTISKSPNNVGTPSISRATGQPSDETAAEIQELIRNGEMEEVFKPPQRKQGNASQVIFTPKLPMSKVEKVVADAMSALGCGWLISILGFTLGSFFIMKINDYERVFHFNEELSLLLANLLLTFFRDNIGNEIGNLQCTATSAALIYLYLVEFLFLAMESYHVLSYNINMMGRKPMLAWPIVAAVGWTAPALMMFSVITPQYDVLTSQWSCWFNYGQLGILAPVGGTLLALFSVSCVMVEAADQTRYRLPLLDASRQKMITVCTVGLMVILPLNFTTLVMGSMAVYYMEISLFSTVFALNISLGIAFWVFHTLSENKVLNFINKTMRVAWSFCYRMISPNARQEGIGSRPIK